MKIDLNFKGNLTELVENHGFVFQRGEEKLAIGMNYEMNDDETEVLVVSRFISFFLGPFPTILAYIVKESTGEYHVYRLC